MSVPTALILAGGKGSRLAPWSAPKCLMPIHGVPIIHRLLSHLAPHVGQIVTCVGYRADDVAASTLGWNGKNSLMFSYAGEEIPMVGRLLHARKEYGITGTVLVCYGDELADVDIPALMAFHEKTGASLTITAYEQPVGLGVIQGAPGQFERISEDATLFVNIGFALVEERVWAYAQEGMGFSAFVNRVARTLDSVGCYIHTGRRSTINSLADIARAEEVWA